MRSVFVLFSIGSFCVGVALGSVYEYGVHFIPFILFIGVLFGFYSFVSLRQGRTATTFFLVSLCFCLVGAGMLRMHFALGSNTSLDVHLGSEVLLTGIVVDEPDLRESVVQLTVQPQDTAHREHILVSINRMEYLRDPIQYGDTLVVSGKLTKPEPFATDNGRTFAYAEFLKARGVAYTIPFALIHEKKNGKESILQKMYAIKSLFSERVRASIVEPYAGLGEGILLGVKRAIGPKLEGVFRETGIMHIVVLSGYNILLVIELTFLILARVCAPRMRMLLGFVAIWVFVLFVGMSPSIVRAGFMASVLLFTQMTGRIYHALTVLFLVGFLMVLHNPYVLVWDPGFQLSFLATLGLILGMPLIEPKLTWVTTKYNLRSIIASTISAQVFVLPLLLYQTGLFSLVSFPVNVLVLPMVPMAMLLTFCAGIAQILFVPLGMLLGFLAYLALGYIVGIATFFSHLPFASVTLGVFPLWFTILVYILYILGIYFLKLDAGANVVKNEYADWTIEEEGDARDKGPLLKNHYDDLKGPLPFR